MDFQTSVLLLDGDRGIYLPQGFAESVHTVGWHNVSEGQIATLKAGPDHKWYWAVWGEILDSAFYQDERGTWRLFQEGDLFLIHDDHVWGD